MLVKMWNAQKEGWVYVDGVRSVEVTYKYCPHYYESTGEISYVLVMKHKDGLKKNKSVICPVDFDFIDPEFVGTDDGVTRGVSTKYNTEDVYSAKLLFITFESKETAAFALTSDRDAYILNKDGKTIERI